MPIVAGLLVTTLLVSGAETPSPTPAPVASSSQPQSQEDPGSSSSSTDKPHQVGLGGFGGSGGGPSFRYFFGEQIGIDVTGGWYRPMTGRGASAATACQVSPSMIVMLNKSNTLADLDLRPYVGGGVIYMSSPTPVGYRTSTVIRQNGWGMQAFGGVEITVRLRTVTRDQRRDDLSQASSSEL